MQTKLDLWKIGQKNPEVVPFPVKTSDRENKEKRKGVTPIFLFSVKISFKKYKVHFIKNV